MPSSALGTGLHPPHDQRMSSRGLFLKSDSETLGGNRKRAVTMGQGTDDMCALAGS